MLDVEVQIKTAIKQELASLVNKKGSVFWVDNFKSELSRNIHMYLLYQLQAFGICGLR